MRTLGLPGCVTLCHFALPVADWFRSWAVRGFLPPLPGSGCSGSPRDVTGQRALLPCLSMYSLLGLLSLGGWGRGGGCAVGPAPGFLCPNVSSSLIPVAVPPPLLPTSIAFLCVRLSYSFSPLYYRVLLGLLLYISVGINSRYFPWGYALPLHFSSQTFRSGTCSWRSCTRQVALDRRRNPDHSPTG